MLFLARVALNVLHSSTLVSYPRLRKLCTLDVSLLYDLAHHTSQRYIHPKF